MKCRRLKIEKDASGNILRRDIVWFGSYGLNHDGTAKFFNANDKHDNYASEAEGVAMSLTQRLNVLQGELWYNINSGIPLWDKHKNTTILDTYITSTILSHPEVKNIIEFSSELIHSSNQKQLTYFAKTKILTNYGELTIETSQVL